MTPAIQVEGIGKRYRLGQAERYSTIRDKVRLALGAPGRKLKELLSSERAPQPEPAAIWALDNVSFNIQPGEVVGIIGRNGSGKSTLLKILSRITTPTVGKATIHGRVSSLLEVGTGFHPELSGRENIVLNGAILGMKRAEVARKFDEIVAFAELEKFIDTPVKRYSSGMYLRLAFAVAAHLDPEILLVDEVLAVGDARFQKKCVETMERVGKQGRTVLFVSHQMQAITRLCPRAILLDEGKLMRQGPSSAVVGDYLRSGLGTTASREWSDLSTAPGNDLVRLVAVRVRRPDGTIGDVIDIRQPVTLEVEYYVHRIGTQLAPNLHIYNDEGVCVFITTTPPAQQPSRIGRHTSTTTIPGNFLSEGTLIINAAISTLSPVIVHVHERDAVAFEVIDSLDGDSARGPDFGGRIPGVVRPLLEWKTVHHED